MSTTAVTPGLATDEYERRREFLTSLKGLTKAEYIEIARILQRYSVPYSENLNGIFFNVGALDQTVFDALVKFLEFTKINRRELAERELFMSSLATEIRLHDTSVMAVAAATR
jgi:hypothetical protein